jgi:hypothetical protein
MRPTRLRASSTDPLALLVLCLAACGSSSTNGGSVTADQACSDAANASCAALDRCHANGVALRYGDMTTCLTRIRSNCLTSLGARGTGRTPESEEACAQATMAAACSDVVNSSIAACAPPAGTLANGAACNFPGQCASAFCGIAPGAKCGTCMAPPSPGSSCATNGCGPGLVCASGGMVCNAPGTAGAACASSDECQVGFACVGAAGGAPGTCMAAAETLGAACDRKSGPQCDYLRGLYCSFPASSTSGTCVTYLSAMAGQPCGFVAGTGTSGSTFTVCVGGSSCVIATGNAGTCVAYATDGKACDTAGGPRCLAPARCVISGGGTAGTCMLSDPTTCT